MKGEEQILLLFDFENALKKGICIFLKILMSFFPETALPGMSCEFFFYKTPCSHTVLDTVLDFLSTLTKLQNLPFL